MRRVQVRVGALRPGPEDGRFVSPLTRRVGTVVARRPARAPRVVGVRFAGDDEVTFLHPDVVVEVAR